MYYHHYIILELCVRLYVRRFGRSAEVIWPRDTSGYIPGPGTLEARTRRSLRAPAWVLATGTNTSFLDGLYKTKQQTGTYIQWSAVRQAAWSVRSRPSGHYRGSRFWLWLLAYSSLAKGDFFGQLIDLDMCSSRIPWMCMLNREFQNG